MRKSDKLSKKDLDRTISSKDKNLLAILRSNKKLLDKAIQIKKSYKLSDRDFLELIKNNIPIPLSIFKNSSPLESLVKYLKDNLNFTLKEIASLLDRDQRTIWITYNNAVKKKITLAISSKVTVPLEIFADRKYSALENLVSYLLDQGYKISEISELLNRNYKTIWTLAKRARDKNE